MDLFKLHMAVSHVDGLFIILKIVLQGVPRNMTVGE